MLPSLSRWYMENWGLGSVNHILVKPPEVSCTWTSLLHEVIVSPNHTLPTLETSLALGHQTSQHSLGQGQWCFPVPQARAALSLHCLGLSQPASQLLPRAAYFCFLHDFWCPGNFSLSFHLLFPISILAPGVSQCRRQKAVGILNRKEFNGGN